MTSKTHQIGTVSQTMILSRLVALGFEVVLPWNDHLGYDLAYIVNHEESHFGFFRHQWVEVVRIQCKTASFESREKDNAVLRINTSSVNTWGTKRHFYHGEAEYIAAYSEYTGKVYMISMQEIGKRQGVTYLRLGATKNNQGKGVRWAVDYEI